MSSHNYYVYIMASGKVGTLYIGVTNNIERRVSEHKQKIGSKFTKKYEVMKLMYYEHFTQIKFAIAREKAMKAWKRSWKIQLIESVNPHWEDLWNKFGLTE